MYDCLLLAQDIAQQGRDGNPWSGIFGFNWIEIVGALVAALTGILGSFLAYYKVFIQNRNKHVTAAIDQKNKFYDTLVTEYNSLRTLYNEQQASILILQNEILVLKQELKFYTENRLASESREILKQIMDADTRPFWIHDLGNNKWYTNRAFSNLFSIRKGDFWAPLNPFARYKDLETATYLLNELNIVATNTTVTTEEIYNTDILNPNSAYKMRVLVEKTPIKVGDNNYVAAKIIEILEENIPNPPKKEE